MSKIQLKDSARDQQSEAGMVAPMIGPRIVHMTSAHPRHDTRIYVKMCRSLAAGGNRVTLIVADGLGPDIQDGIEILDVGQARGRLARMFGTTYRILSSAISLNGDLYHFHDPELLPIGAALRGRGKVVVYDAHEDVGRDVLGKTYIPRILRPLVARAAETVEKHLSNEASAIVGATPVIAKKFQDRGKLALAVNNFPILDELCLPHESASTRHRSPNVCYVGGIAGARGIREMVQAFSKVASGARLLLAGEFFEPGLEAEVSSYPGWSNVDRLGVVDRAGVRDVMSRSSAGLVTLHPTPAYKEALPVKMFEYMAAGLPVIASDFPLWRSIIAEAECGLLVDPMDPASIASAIDWINEHPEKARRMGDRGRAAVIKRYNWDQEAAKLSTLYQKLAGQSRPLAT